MSLKEISSLQHPLVKYMAKLQRSAKYRNECRRIVVDGERVIEEIAERAAITALLATDSALFERRIPFEEGYLVTPSIVEKITGNPCQKGALAEVAMPEESSLKGCLSLVVLDRIQDPGNVGAIARSALAFGWEGIYLVRGCCDPFNDKAMRASRGALFSLPFRKGSFEELLQLVEGNEMALYAADMEGESLEEAAKRLPEKIAVAFGNEGEGLSCEARNCKMRVAIPISPRMESLNVAVAAGIVLYRLQRV